ncbi:uncharacterized protein LOC126837059 [Adelges cooleyi]|uniref:uncharacterized protein LOC126837059 n=1 Tax=Adelges cooleyi TaxID=133065 RepID=UPI00218067F5|nr:uncharacterized protein LOC126837059 [Adelges cooleyi]
MNQIHALTSRKIGRDGFEIKVRFNTNGFMSTHGRHMSEICNALLVDSILTRLDNSRTDNIETVTIEEIRADLFELVIRMNTTAFRNGPKNRIFQFSADALGLTLQHLALINGRPGESLEEMRQRIFGRSSRSG